MSIPEVARKAEASRETSFVHQTDRFGSHHNDGLTTHRNNYSEEDYKSLSGSNANNPNGINGSMAAVRKISDESYRQTIGNLKGEDIANLDLIKEE